MPSKHPWKFVSSEIDLVGASLKNDKYIESWEKGELQELLISSGYFSDPRFTWVSCILRLGLKNDKKTKFGRINKTYEDLPITKELDTRVLLTADENDADMLLDFLKIAALDSLIDAGYKYKLNHDAIKKLQKERSKLGIIPEWEYEMDEHPEIMLNKYRESKPLAVD